MDTNTRSTSNLRPLFGPPDDLDLDETDEMPSGEPDPWSDLGESPRSRRRAELMAVIDAFGDTPGGRRVLHCWDQHELLADALQLIADRLDTDPLRLDARDLAAAFGTDLFRRLVADPPDLSLLPDLIAGFVPYAHALGRLSSSETASSLAVIEQCRRGFLASVDRHLDAGLPTSRSRWDQCGPGLPRWQPPPRPTPLERLADEVGGTEILDTLGTEPLPDEPVDLTDVAEDIRDRVRAAIAYADPVAERVFGVEIRVAMRRLLVDAAVVDPAIFRRKGRIDTLGAGACLAVLRANQVLGPQGGTPAKEFAGHFGLTSAPDHRAETLRAALTGARWDAGSSLRSPRYLTSRRRRDIVAARRVLCGGEVVDQAS